MKFIANSKYLKSQIQKAFDVECRTYKRNDDNITFYSETADPDIWTNLHFLQKDSGELETFHPLMWAKAMLFLKTIPEQPITVVVEHEEIEITAISVFK